MSSELLTYLRDSALRSRGHHSMTLTPKGVRVVTKIFAGHLKEGRMQKVKTLVRWAEIEDHLAFPQAGGDPLEAVFLEHRSHDPRLHHEIAREMDSARAEFRRLLGDMKKR